MRTSERDIKAFEHLFKRNYVRLCKLAYYYLEDDEEAKDIVNDVFESAWRHYDSLTDISADSYLCTAVKNRCLNHLEHRKVRQLFHDQQQRQEMYAEEENIEDKESLFQQIEKICDQFPEKTRYIVSQCYFHHKKYKEVAEELAITPDAVKKHIMKALKLLRQSISINKE